MDTPHKELPYTATVSEIIYLINCWNAYCELYAKSGSRHTPLDHAIPCHNIYIKAPLRRDIARTLRYFLDDTCTAKASVYNLYVLINNTALTSYTQHQLHLLIDYFISQCVAQKRTAPMPCSTQPGREYIDHFYSVRGAEKMIKTLGEIMPAMTHGDISLPLEINEGKHFSEHVMLSAKKSQLVDTLIRRKKLTIKDYLKWFF